MFHLKFGFIIMFVGKIMLKLFQPDVKIMIKNHHQYYQNVKGNRPGGFTRW